MKSCLQRGLIMVCLAIPITANTSPSASAQQTNSASDLAKQVSISASLKRQSLEFTDIDGGPHALPTSGNYRCSVFVFINTTCPIANAYHPTLTRMRSEFADSKFDFVLVHTDPELSVTAARQHQQEYKITWPIALDPGNSIARHVNAKVTPEAFVVDAKGNVLYRGRIDDRHQELGRKRPAPTSNDLRDALASIRDDRPIAIAETKAVGCVIHFESENDANAP